ncbi:MAG TPA: nitroreductase family protein [Methanomicrobiales archaeon]|nr:nitroreductase family protein [Methanomicrobiales archaeon]
MEQGIRDLVKKNRSYRRFHEQRPIARETIIGLVDIARFCPSSRNRQPLRYIVSTDPEETVKIRSCLLFALDLPDWGGPPEGERPVAYVTMVTEGACTPFTAYDAGIAAQTIMLAAAEQGIGGCMVGSIKKEELRSVLSIPDGYEIHLVLAFGYPAEQVVLETVGSDGNTKYWRDAGGTHHVPKRSLKEVLIRDQV